MTEQEKIEKKKLREVLKDCWETLKGCWKALIKSDKKIHIKEIVKKIGKIILLFLILPFVFLSPFIFFYWKFGSLPISDKPNDWGIFATYVSGTFIPILTIINIYVLYLLTKSAKEIEKNNIKAQLRFTTYNKMKEQFDEFRKKWNTYKEDKDENSFKREINNIRTAFISFCSNNLYLFDNINDSSYYDDLKEAIDNLITGININNFNNYITAKEDFLEFIQDKYLI